MKTIRKIPAVFWILFACCLFVHRRVIRAWIKKEPMPKAPKWHFWVKPEQRRS